MSVVMVRQKVKDDSLQEAEAAVRELFATLERVRPEPALCLDASGGQLDVRDPDRAGRRHPGPAAGDPRVPGFLEQLKGWVDGPPVIEHLEVVGTYNLFVPQRQESAVR